MAFLQQLLDGLASVSGYDEVASAPWLPLGESGHLKMVHALLDEKPDRCIAGILLKNQNLPPHNRVTPVLSTDGTAYEWGQDKTDIRAKWNDVDQMYSRILTARRQNPQWPLSYVIDGHSGHFDCSDRFVNYIAHYIDVITKARLPDKPGEPLKPIDLSKGFSADLPVPGHENPTIQLGAADLAVPWYPDRQLAEQAQRYAAINWKAESQFINFLDDKGNPLPHDFNGITNIKSVSFEDDGITFTMHCRVADKIPGDFVHAGEPLAQTSWTPNVEWLCGPLEPLGGNRFRIALDRTWLGRGGCYLGARQAGNDNVRGILEPTGIDLKALRNTDGKAQKITFPAIANVAIGAAPISLSATSDAGLPVSYFVVEGPAVIQGDKLVLTPIPPRTKFPVNVTVAAWQWGKKGEVQTADVVQQSFQINR